MRLLAGMGVFKEVGHDAFAPTPLAALYITGSPLIEAVVHMYVDLVINSSVISLMLSS